MERMTSWDEDCVLVNGHGLYCLTLTEIVQMAERLAAYEDMDSKRIRPGDTVWLSQMFYTRPKKPVPVTVDAIRIDRNGVTYITGRKRFCEEAIGRTVFLTEEAARKALQGMKGDANTCALIDRVPTVADAVIVTRCKNCIYRIDGLCFSRTPFIHAPAVEPDDFCCWGETK